MIILISFGSRRIQKVVQKGKVWTAKSWYCFILGALVLFSSSSSSFRQVSAIDNNKVNQDVDVAVDEKHNGKPTHNLLQQGQDQELQQQQDNNNKINNNNNNNHHYYTAFDDASWAVTSIDIGNMLGDHIKPRYWNYIDGCQNAMDQHDKTRGEVCFDHDYHSRILMNHNQPSSVYNYTKLGYAKIKAPQQLYYLIKRFYNNYKHKAIVEWDHINPYHNMWEAPTTIVHFNQLSSSFMMNNYNNHNGGGGSGGDALQTEIWKPIKPIMEEWTGQRLSPVALYGIRLYHNGSILAPHVDELPRVASCIINIDQDVDEDWPLEVYGHDGIATNITMEPGDIILYESHSVIHGRPFPLKGNYYANVFLHFEPIGPLLEDPTSTSSSTSTSTNDQQPVMVHDSININNNNNNNDENDIPPYLIPNTPWEEEWKRTHPNGWKKVKFDPVTAAKRGDIEVLKAIRKHNPDALLHVEDELGWRPLHEAVRSGEVESVKLLLSSGADKNHVTKTGVSPLAIAYGHLRKGHPVIEYLESIGAEYIHPEL